MESEIKRCFGLLLVGFLLFGQAISYRVAKFQANTLMMHYVCKRQLNLTNPSNEIQILSMWIQQPKDKYKYLFYPKSYLFQGNSNGHYFIEETDSRVRRPQMLLKAIPKGYWFWVAFKMRTTDDNKCVFEEIIVFTYSNPFARTWYQSSSIYYGKEDILEIIPPKKLNLFQTTNDNLYSCSAGFSVYVFTSYLDNIQSFTPHLAYFNENGVDFSPQLLSNLAFLEMLKRGPTNYYLERMNIEMFKTAYYYPALDGINLNFEDILAERMRNPQRLGYPLPKNKVLSVSKKYTHNMGVNYILYLYNPGALLQGKSLKFTIAIKGLQGSEPVLSGIFSVTIRGSISAAAGAGAAAVSEDATAGDQHYTQSSLTVTFSFPSPTMTIPLTNLSAPLTLALFSGATFTDCLPKSSSTNLKIARGIVVTPMLDGAQSISSGFNRITLMTFQEKVIPGGTGEGLCNLGTFQSTLHVDWEDSASGFEVRLSQVNFMLGPFKYQDLHQTFLLDDPNYSGSCFLEPPEVIWSEVDQYKKNSCRWYFEPFPYTSPSQLSSVAHCKDLWAYGTQCLKCAPGYYPDPINVDRKSYTLSCIKEEDCTQQNRLVLFKPPSSLMVDHRGLCLSCPRNCLNCIINQNTYKIECITCSDYSVLNKETKKCECKVQGCLVCLHENCEICNEYLHLYKNTDRPGKPFLCSNNPCAPGYVKSPNFPANPRYSKYRHKLCVRAHTNCSSSACMNCLTSVPCAQLSCSSQEVPVDFSLALQSSFQYIYKCWPKSQPVKGLVYRHQNNRFEPCGHHACLKCSSIDLHLCLQCLSGWTIVKETHSCKLISECSNPEDPKNGGFFLNSEGICQQCASGCLKCTDKDSCLECDNNKPVWHSLIKKCIIESDCINQPGYYIESKIGLDTCEYLDNCILASKLGSCLQCIKGYSISHETGKCLKVVLKPLRAELGTDHTQTIRIYIEFNKPLLELSNSPEPSIKIAYKNNPLSAIKTGQIDSVKRDSKNPTLLTMDFWFMEPVIPEESQIALVEFRKPEHLISRQSGVSLLQDNSFAKVENFYFGRPPFNLKKRGFAFTGAVLVCLGLLFSLLVDEKLTSMIYKAFVMLELVFLFSVRFPKNFTHVLMIISYMNPVDHLPNIFKYFAIDNGRDCRHINNKFEYLYSSCLFLSTSYGLTLIFLFYFLIQVLFWVVLRILKKFKSKQVAKINKFSKEKLGSRGLFKLITIFDLDILVGCFSNFLFYEPSGSLNGTINIMVAIFFLLLLTCSILYYTRLIALHEQTKARRVLKSLKFPYQYLQDNLKSKSKFQKYYGVWTLIKDYLFSVTIILLYTKPFAQTVLTSILFSVATFLEIKHRVFLSTTINCSSIFGWILYSTLCFLSIPLLFMVDNRFSEGPKETLIGIFLCILYCLLLFVNFLAVYLNTFQTLHKRWCRKKKRLSKVNPKSLKSALRSRLSKQTLKSGLRFREMMSLKKKVSVSLQKKHFVLQDPLNSSRSIIPKQTSPKVKLVHSRI